MPADNLPGGKNVKVELEDGIAWVTLNRPEKRNCMSPALNDEMVEVLDALEVDDRCQVAGADRRGRCVLGRHGSARILPRHRRPALCEADARAPLVGDVAMAASSRIS